MQIHRIATAVGTQSDRWFSCGDSIAGTLKSDFNDFLVNRRNLSGV
jgi:hypothetical protein